MLIDRNNQILSINGSAARIFAADSAMAVCSDLLTLCREASVLEIVKAAQAGDSGGAVLPRDNRTYRVFVSPVLREDKVRGVVLLALDISARYAAEASRREFTANVSHELKTPLTFISGYAKIIENGIAPKRRMCLSLQEKSAQKPNGWLRWSMTFLSCYGWTRSKALAQRSLSRCCPC